MAPSKTLLLAQAMGAMAVGTLNYTDSNSGISFAGYTDGDGLTVGMAMPSSPTTDLIANIVGPIVDGAAGWAGLDMGVTMANKLLLVAWPNLDTEEVVLTARVATAYSNPPVYSGDVTLSPIPEGTYINATHYSATFLCAGCMADADLSFDPTAESGTFAYAYSNDAVDDPSDPAATLTYHSAGFSGFGLTLADAQFAEYADWAAQAEDPADDGSGDDDEDPTTPPINNGTIPVSNVTYDYIVAGGGPAGLVAATRFAESGASVLLLERGGPSVYSVGGEDVTSWNASVTDFDVPGMAYHLSSAVPSDAYCADVASMAGCVLGGGGAVNALMFVRPRDADFDAELGWPEGWRGPDMKAAADRFFERNPGTDLPSADGLRYDEGAWEAFSSFFGEDGAMAFDEVDSLADPERKHDVYARPPWNIQDGLRGGPMQTYLPDVEDLDNFTLQMHTKVIRAVRGNSNSTSFVSGVEVELPDGSAQIIRVTPETGKVVLAAGALSTPRILFYSGIGPLDQLSRVPSTVRMPPRSQWLTDLPVGQGVKDHPILSFPMRVSPELLSQISESSDDSPLGLPDTAFTDPSNATTSLFAQGSGLLSQSGQRFALWTSVVSPADGQTRFLQGTGAANSDYDDVVNLKVYVTHGLTSATDLVLDEATGKNTEFTETPYLTTEGDVQAYEAFAQRLLDAMRRNDTSTPGLSLLQTSADGSPTAEVVPANMTAAEVVSMYRANGGLSSGSHFVGSARMGDVVDADTRVLGTDNLFVVDASAHPDLPTGNTQAIVMVVAERAAERIMGGGGVTPPSGGGEGDDGGCEGEVEFAPFGQQKQRRKAAASAMAAALVGPGAGDSSGVRSEARAGVVLSAPEQVKRSPSSSSSWFGLGAGSGASGPVHARSHIAKMALRTGLH